jgi:hypothetical protein
LDVPVVRLVVLTFYRVGGDAVLTDQRSGNVVLSAEGVAGAQDYISASLFKGNGQVGSLTGHVQTGRKSQARQWLFFGEAAFNQTQNAHLALRPHYSIYSGFRQGQVLDIPDHLMRGQYFSPYL